MANFSDGCNKQLIELVRKHPALYDQQHAKYHDTIYKKKVWNTIGAFMEEDAVVCRIRWKNIRYQYRKTTNKNKYSEQLSFLNEYPDAVDDVKSQSSKLPPSLADHSAEAQLNEESTDESSHNICLDELILKSEPIEPESSPNDPLEDATEDPTDPVPKKLPIRIIRRIKRPATANSADSNEAQTMEILLQKVQAAQHPSPVDAFLTGISPALKNLPPQYWNQAKSELFSVVHKYEQKMLTDPSPEFYPDRWCSET